MSDNKDTMIQVKDLHKSFGKNNVLNGISTDIKKGEVVVVIGPAGSGKSTFLRSLNLLEQPTSGSIIFDGDYRSEDQYRPAQTEDGNGIPAF